DRGSRWVPAYGQAESVPPVAPLISLLVREAAYHVNSHPTFASLLQRDVGVEWRRLKRIERSPVVFEDSHNPPGLTGQPKVDFMLSALPGVTNHVDERLLQREADVQPAGFRQAGPRRKVFNRLVQPGHRVDVVRQVEIDCLVLPDLHRRLSPGLP